MTVVSVTVAVVVVGMKTVVDPVTVMVVEKDTVVDAVGATEDVEFTVEVVVTVEVGPYTVRVDVGLIATIFL